MSLRGRYAPEAITLMVQGGCFAALAMTGWGDVIARSAFCAEAISSMVQGGCFAALAMTLRCARNDHDTSLRFRSAQGGGSE